MNYIAHICPLDLINDKHFVDVVEFVSEDGKDKVDCHYEYRHKYFTFYRVDAPFGAPPFAHYCPSEDTLELKNTKEIIVEPLFIHKKKIVNSKLREKDNPFTANVTEKLSKRMKNFKTEDIGEILEEVSKETKLRKLGYVEAVLEQHGFLELAEFIRNLEV
jgi:hypothetical protein